MSAGIVDHEAHTRDIRRLGGLRKLMPVTFTIATLAALSMAGIPLLNGFLSKEMMLEEAYWNRAVWRALACPCIGDRRFALFRRVLLPSYWSRLPRPRARRLPRDSRMIPPLASGCRPRC